MMARRKSDDRRAAILEAAVDTIAEQGLGAPTATIAARAGVAHGSVFTYFATKAELFNAVYLLLKGELDGAVLDGLPGPAPDAVLTSDDARPLFRHLWTRWTRWGVAHPARRRALARLGVSDLITPASHAAALARIGPAAEIVRRASAGGALAGQSLEFVGSVVEGLAGTTMDYMIRDPARADAYCDAGFEAAWRALA